MTVLLTDTLPRLWSVAPHPSEDVVACGSDRGVHLVDSDGATRLLESMPMVFSMTWRGDSLFAGALGGAIRRFDAPDVSAGAEKADVPGHTADTVGLTTAPGDRALASASYDDTADLRTPDGTVEHTLRGHTDHVRAVAFTRSGHRLATGSYDGSVRVWDTATGEPVARFEAPSAVRAVDIVGDELVVGGSTDGSVLCWPLDGAGEAHTLARHSAAAVYAVAVNPDTGVVASGGEDATVRLHDLEGNELDVLEGHEHTVSALRWRRSELVSAGWDGRLQVCTVPTP